MLKSGYRSVHDPRAVDVFLIACFCVRKPAKTGFLIGGICMAQIRVNDLSFTYEGSFDPVFEHVSFSIDTRWKLGFIGRNGKGKTTFLNILRGRLEYTGSITGQILVDYFPYDLPEDRECSVFDCMEEWKPGVESWRVMVEMDSLKAAQELLYRPISSLSFGERTKLMLAVLFAGENDFLLIDEPTNHLDMAARAIVKEYLAGKQGFILVSHDRDLLDGCIDHVLVLNRQNIEVQAGNFSSWWENKEKKDAFARAENEKHLKEISKLKASADRAARWAEKNENTKIGFDPIKEHDRFLDTRAHIGAKTKKMQSKVKAYQGRMQREIEEKEGLLEDVEQEWKLKLEVLEHPKKRLIAASEYTLSYGENPSVFDPVTFEVMQGEIVFLHGENGCGKSSLIKAILGRVAARQFSSDGMNSRSNAEDAGLGSFAIHEQGQLEAASNLVVSYIHQDTSALQGDLRTYAAAHGLDVTLFFALLRRLDFERIQFEKNMEDYSEGQKKKVLLASSLLTPAHLYIWDEPLNYIDVFSRMQIEELLKTVHPTMLVVEHDIRFMEQFATKVIELKA